MLRSLVGSEMCIRDRIRIVFSLYLFTNIGVNITAIATKLKFARSVVPMLAVGLVCRVVGLFLCLRATADKRDCATCNPDGAKILWRQILRESMYARPAYAGLTGCRKVLRHFLDAKGNHPRRVGQCFDTQPNLYRRHLPRRAALIGIWALHLSGPDLYFDLFPLRVNPSHGTWANAAREHWIL
eukprot:TRINITY_DN5175_c0_g1_i1.p1 TRINITY_DN5175_c0_g1~~TRINITY_DN5175_c0_g1_i1.p1  ORF type:complete len:184 (+),score=21.37 TRINITY_DN5175_c0_g1_i1:129-680(+)